MCVVVKYVLVILVLISTKEMKIREPGFHQIRREQRDNLSRKIWVALSQISDEEDNHLLASLHNSINRYRPSKSWYSSGAVLSADRGSRYGFCKPMG
jgi:hypothetical protein